MTTAAYLLLYGAMVTWLSPPILARLTHGGLSPRLGVAAWVTAIVGVLVAWTVAVSLIVVSSLSGFPKSSVFVLCLELLGVPEREATPGWLILAVLIVTGLAVSTVVTVKASRSILTSRSTSREHAHAARMIGVSTGRPNVFVVTADQPVAYCVAGRPHAIVVTTAAVARLAPEQLSAVLAHETAHLSGGHHHLLMVLRGLANSLSLLPLFTRGAAAVAELVEMCADDSSARLHGARPLVSGMLTLAGPLPSHGGGLAVAATAVFARANRLLDPPLRGRRWRHQLLLCATIAATVTAPVLLNVLCQH